MRSPSCPLTVSKQRFLLRKVSVLVLGAAGLREHLARVVIWYWTEHLLSVHLSQMSGNLQVTVLKSIFKAFSEDKLHFSTEATLRMPVRPP